MKWYAKILCHHPYAVLSSVIIVVGICLALSLTARPLPNFTDPALGFESRGTEISSRATAWENLLEATKTRGSLVVNPLQSSNIHFGYDINGKQGLEHTHKACIEMTENGPVQVENCAEFDNRTRSTATGDSNLDTLRNIDRQSGGTQDSDYNYDWPDTEQGSFFDQDDSNQGTLERSSLKGFFCNKLGTEYAHVVVGPKSGIVNLFTFTNLRTICRLDARLRQVAEMKAICQKSRGNTCCPSWSLPNYIAKLSNKTSCLDITKSDVLNARRLFRMCARKLDLKLARGCSVAGCRSVPEQCLLNDSVYDILHYLTDATFLQPQTNTVSDKVKSTTIIKKTGPMKTPSSPHGPRNSGVVVSKSKPSSSSEPKYPVVKQRHHLQQLGQRQQQDQLFYSAIFLPIAKSSQSLPYFEAILKKDISVNGISVLAMDFGLKNLLFDKLLVSDSVLLAAGVSVVVLLIWFYTGSLFITIITITTVACSLLIAYFLYVFIYEIPFFPYMNILTAVIAIGLGADDTFVYCRVWNLAKEKQDSGSIVKILSEAMHHAAASIVVTSLTTAAAFLASFISPITAIKCFSIYAGTVVIANLILMLTWVPACVVIAERWGANTCCVCVPPAPAYAQEMDPKCSQACRLPLKFCYSCTEMGKLFFEKILPTMVIKPKHFWIVLLGLLASCSTFIVFYYPGLRLPDTQEFQLFDTNHPFEQYDLKYKYHFWFERNIRRDIVNRLPIRVVWGVRPVDNGDYLDPSYKGTLEFDETFDMSDPQSQLWLLNFCKKLRNQTFCLPSLEALLPHCFIDTFKISMERKCVDQQNRLNRYPCCEESSFPYSREVFDQCIQQGVADLYQTPLQSAIPGVAGPKFSKTTGKIKAIVVEYDSTYMWSLSYEYMHRFFTEVEKWVSKEMQSAPPGLRNGWFISYLNFYDVQRSLSVGTGQAVAVAVTVCLAVLLLTTLNVVVSLLAVISVAAVIVVTLAALVLSGWRLNVLESVTVSVAIGLAVDLTLHYGVAYRLSPEAERHPAVVWAISRLGSPVLMAALTSIGAGVAMLPARVLAYVHVGTFLTVLTAASYAYSTFFYLPLLSMMGPERGFAQLSYPKCTAIRNRFKRRQPVEDKPVYQQPFISESTLSTSSNCGPAMTSPTTTTGVTDACLEPIPLRKSSSRRRHVPVTRMSSGSSTLRDQQTLGQELQVQPQTLQVASPKVTIRRSARSGSLSSSMSGRERRERALRKVSLPSPSGRELEIGLNEGVKRGVGPTLSATTILYSDPDNDSVFGHTHLHGQPLKSPRSPSYFQQSVPLQFVYQKSRDSCSSRGSFNNENAI